MLNTKEPQNLLVFIKMKKVKKKKNLNTIQLKYWL